VLKSDSKRFVIKHEPRFFDDFVLPALMTFFNILQ